MVRVSMIFTLFRGTYRSFQRGTTNWTDSWSSRPSCPWLVLFSK